MKKVLRSRDVVYDFNMDNILKIDGEFVLPQYEKAYKEIKTALLLDSYGYNIYLVDEFCKERVKHIINYAKHILKDKPAPKDICYVVKDDPKEPVPLIVSNGNGNKLKSMVESVQNTYAELIFKFYNSLKNDEKEELISAIKEKRSKIVEDLIELSKSFGFDIRVGEDGFTFVPLVEEKEMTEEEYDELTDEEKKSIIDNVNELKVSANTILEKLRNMSYDELTRIKEILHNFFEEELKEMKDNIDKEFEGEESVLSYLSYIVETMEKELIENYSINYEDDEEKIKEIIFKYDVKVVVDNSEIESPPVIYEDDPSVANLLGSIDYENHNNVYVSTVDSIRVGSYIKANGGCLILRASSLLNNPQSYYYLKKSIISDKVNLDYNRGYLELFTLGGLRPAQVEVNTKVIIIGDFEIYNVLYNYDKEFRTIFRLKSEYKGILENEDKTKAVLINEINSFVYKNNIKPITSGAVKEIAKYLARKAENRSKFFFDHDELAKLLVLANYKVQDEERNCIDESDIISVAYDKETIEEEYLKLYEENKILLQVQGSEVGQINGLSVIDIGYASFGKPTRITCTCWKGEGKIIDAQRESNLSGNIHTKGVSILKGYINNLNEGIKKLPVDFNLSFEQLYGLIDGDSASAAEALVIVSALGKIPIRQNIAITGSINQFGVIQPIGGVNEKIEGFFNICKLKGSIEGNGVIIPLSNFNELVLSREVEQAIIDGDFTLYTVEKVEDAMEILYDIEVPIKEEVLKLIEKQCELYDTDKNKEDNLSS